MRDLMPLTTDFIDRRRAEWGKAHVDHCLREAKAGKPGFFYAIEAGHVVGTPFAATSPMAEWQAKAVLCGAKFAAFIAEPEAARGKD
jgi:hypothetical protein